MAQEPSKPVAAEVRGFVLSMQAAGNSADLLIAMYEGRIAELKRLCGDPCKDK